MTVPIVEDEFAIADLLEMVLADGFRQILRRLQGQAFFHCAAHDEAITRRAIRLA